jgi:hypothetical protein
MTKMKIQGQLTPHFLSAELSPFLEALEGLQHTIDAIKNTPPSPVVIKEIATDDSEVPPLSEKERLAADLERLGASYAALGRIKAAEATWKYYREHASKLEEAIARQQLSTYDAKMDALFRQFLKMGMEKAKGEPVATEKWTDDVLDYVKLDTPEEDKAEWNALLGRLCNMVMEGVKGEPVATEKWTDDVLDYETPDTSEKHKIVRPSRRRGIK